MFLIGMYVGLTIGALMGFVLVSIFVGGEKVNDYFFKYKLGDQVYCVFKDGEFVQVIQGQIEEIAVSKNGICYYISELCEEFEEKELVLVKDKQKLAQKIDELLNK